MTLLKNAEDAWRETSEDFKAGLDQSLDQFKKDWKQQLEIANSQKIDWATKSAEYRSEAEDALRNKEKLDNDKAAQKVEELQVKIKDAEHHASNSLERLKTIKGDAADREWENFSKYNYCKKP